MSSQHWMRHNAVTTCRTQVGGGAKRTLGALLCALNLLELVTRGWRVAIPKALLQACSRGRSPPRRVGDFV
eukprot:413303-Amphidinium_carterae.2